MSSDSAKCGWPHPDKAEPCGQPATVVYLTWPWPLAEFTEGRYTPSESVLPLCADHNPESAAGGDTDGTDTD